MIAHLSTWTLALKLVLRFNPHEPATSLMHTFDPGRESMYHMGGGLGRMSKILRFKISYETMSAVGKILF